jgi:hypothetical protein
MRRWLPLGVLAFVGLVLIASLQSAFQHRVSSSVQGGPAAYWSFSARLGDRVIDAARGHDGLVYYPRWVTSVEYFSHNVVLELDGEKTYVEVPSGGQLTFEGAFTVAGWVNVESHAKRQILLFKGDSQGDFRAAPIVFYVPWGEGRLGLVLSDRGKRVGFLSDRAIRRNQWRHVAVSYDDQTGRIRFYIDGEAAGERTTSWRPRRHSGPLYIGMGRVGDENFFPFRGQIESLVLFERELSPGEIQALAQRIALPEMPER